MINLEGVLTQIANKFSQQRIRYALIGGLALHAAGHHRSTGDIDFLVHADDILKAKDILVSLGYVLMAENVEALRMGGPWGFIGGVDIIKAHRAYTLAMLERAKPYAFSKEAVLLSVTAEDLIGLKVQALCNDPARKPQDLADIEWLIRQQAGSLNMALIDEYFGLFSLKPELDKIFERIKNAE